MSMLWTHGFFPLPLIDIVMLTGKCPRGHNSINPPTTQQLPQNHKLLFIESFGEQISLLLVSFNLLWDERTLNRQLKVGSMSKWFLTKWCFTAMHLVLGVILGAVQVEMQPLLSSNTLDWTADLFSVKLKPNFKHNSEWVWCIGTKALMAVARAMHSASRVKVVISVCNLDAKLMGHPPKVTTCPVLDLT